MNIEVEEGVEEEAEEVFKMERIGELLRLKLLTFSFFAYSFSSKVVLSFHPQSSLFHCCRYLYLAFVSYLS